MIGSSNEHGISAYLLEREKILSMWHLDGHWEWKGGREKEGHHKN